MMSDSSASLRQLGPGTHEPLHNHHHNGCYTNAQTAHYKSAAVTHKGNAPAFAQQQERDGFLLEKFPLVLQAGWSGFHLIRCMFISISVDSVIRIITALSLVSAF